MVTVRNNLASVRAGGPRQYNELRERLIITVSDNREASDLLSELDRLGMDGEILRNFPVVVSKPAESLQDVLERVGELDGDRFTDRAVEEIANAGVDDVVDATTDLMRSTAQMIGVVSELPQVVNVGFVRSYADFGPENLRVSPTDIPTVTAGETDKSTQGDLMEREEMNTVWSLESGDEAIVCVFDTGYAEDLIDSSRIVDTFHGDSVRSVFASEEGHGTMCAGAAVANTDDGVPYNGIAKDADVMLVRITDDEGQIRGDIIANAWDWLMDKRDGSMAGGDDRPIITNHSYGMPICNSRPRQAECESPDAEIIKLANSTPQITSVYAAGNEAMHCGHRLAGFTNGITGVNSLAEVFTVGALRYDMVDAQRYSSHGRGDCSPIADPKPNCSFPLPEVLYYGAEDGYELKDMSTGFGGSSGGTSTAAPYTAGAIALLQSRSMKKRGRALQTEELERIIEDNSSPPRRTQVNILPGVTGSGWDARFGHGKIDILEALKEV